MKRIFFFSFIILLLIYIHSSFQAIYDLWQKQTLLTRARQELRVQQKVNTELKKQVIVVSNPIFIESEARNKLFLIRPGEKKVIISGDLLVSGAHVAQKAKGISHWQAWWNLFF